MINASQITSGMILSIDQKLYCVESIHKSDGHDKGESITFKLRDFGTERTLEKSFQPSDQVKDVSLSERTLEFLYPEDEDYLFLDIETLDEVTITRAVIGPRIEYMKAGVQVRASAYSEAIVTIELPQFLELMVADVEDQFVEATIAGAVPSKSATLETGARLKVPSFVEIGDVIKIDTRAEEYIQRI